MAGVHYPTNAGQAWARREAIGGDARLASEVPILLKSVVQWTDWAQCMVCQYEDQQKIADRKNCRQSIFLSHWNSYECMRVAPLVRITLGSIKRSSPRLRSWSEISALGRYGPWRPPEYCLSHCLTLRHRY